MEVARLGQLAVGLEKGRYTVYFISTNITQEILTQEAFTNKLHWKIFYI